MTPVFKKGDPNICSNFRPISLLSIFIKVFEKCVYHRIYKFLSKHEVIYERQFGFRSGYSINYALISLTETIRKYLENE